jgi:hypothetical protein
MGVERSPSTHSNPEIAPPVEGLSTARKWPAVSLTDALALNYLTLSCPQDSPPGNFLGDKSG